MYINELNYRNIGPIGQLDLVFRRNTNGVPVPTVFVGKNGSGKSILLSNMVDAFYEIANKVYQNATQVRGRGYQYYKRISATQIQIGQNYMTAYLRFQQGNEQIAYIYKSGEISFDCFKSTLPSAPDKSLDWHDDVSYKNVSVQKKVISDVFDKNIICFFSPN